MSSLKRYWVILIALVVGYCAFEYYRPKPLNWNPTYSNKDAIPFGGEALFRLLPGIMEGQPVVSVRVPPYNHLRNDSLRRGHSSYVFISSRFSPDPNDEKALLDYAAAGNSVFISAYDLPDSLMKVLGVEALQHDPTPKDTARYVHFVNPRLGTKKGHIFPRDDGTNYLKIRDVKNVTLLAVNDINEPVFVRVKRGKGAFFIHNLPLALTNYFVVDPEKSAHAFQALSYLPVQPVYWDEYQKQGRFGEDEKSVFRFILSQPALRTAWYLLLAGLLLFVIFSGKRRQRIIPVVDPPKNVSLEFVQTIGNMYYKKGDHANLSWKLAQHFWMYVRERFTFSATHFDEQKALDELVHKGGMSEEEIASLKHNLFDEREKWTSERLLRFNDQLEKFYKQTR